MATAYKADNYNDVPVFIPGIIGGFVRPFKYDTAAAAGFVINDTVLLCDIPYRSGAGGVLVLGYHIEIPSLDTGTSVVLTLGDTNGSAGAFQATFISGTNTVGQNAAGALNHLACMGATDVIAVANVPVRGVVPKQYTSATATSGVLSFVLKVATAANTATTTGVIKGYLMLQPLGTNSVTF